MTSPSRRPSHVQPRLPREAAHKTSAYNAAAYRRGVWPREQAESKTNGADDGIRTRDPHLGNVKRTVRRVRPSPLTWAPVRQFVRPARPVRPFRVPVYHRAGLATSRPGRSVVRRRQAQVVLQAALKIAPDSPWRVDRSDTHIPGSERACRRRRIWAPQISLTWSGD